MSTNPFDADYVAPAPEPQPAPAQPEPKAARAKAAPRAPRAAPADNAEPEEPPVEYPKTIADGIYFGMLDDAYHAIERLSTSGMQAMMVSPATFWAGSWLNPDREDKPVKHRIYGRATHAADLEPELFRQNYARELDKAELPKGALITGKDMEAALVGMGLAKSGSVAEQAQRLRDGGYVGTVWQWELEAWERVNAGRIGLPAPVYDEITEGSERLRSSPQVAELLTGGAAEVSVFWTCAKTGIPMKCRIDYLKPDLWADLKSFDNTRGKRLEQAIADAFRYNRYYVQAVSYREAVEAIRSGLVDLVGECEPWQRELIDAIQLAPAPLACWYVFREKGGVPNIIARRFRFSDVHSSHDVHKAGLDAHREAISAEAMGKPTLITRKAMVEIEHAKRTYLNYSEIYEPGEPWLPFEPLGEIGDEDFNSYWLEGMTQ